MDVASSTGSSRDHGRSGSGQQGVPPEPAAQSPSPEPLPEHGQEGPGAGDVDGGLEGPAGGSGRLGARGPSGLDSAWAAGFTCLELSTPPVRFVISQMLWQEYFIIL